MQKIHFFNLHNRLGLINKPNGQKELNIGVEDAPSFIVTKKFATKFENTVIDTFVFVKPETVINEIAWLCLQRQEDKVKETIYQQTVLAEKLISAKYKKNEIQVVIGGDHSVTFPSFLAVLNRFENNQKIGYIQFDSHGDMNLYKDSPTKNFHGMYVRPFIDTFDVKNIDDLVRKKLPKENVWFIGNLNLDKQEKIFFKKSKIKNTTTKNMTNKKEVLRKFKEFVNEFNHIHISIDVDVFDKSQVLATGIPAVHGFFWKDIKPFLEILAKQKSISVDMTEVNPKKKGAKTTIALAQKMLTVLLLKQIE